MTQRNPPADGPQVSAETRDPRGHGAKSEAVRARAIMALLTEKSIGDAAARCGVNEKTLRRWLSADAEFQAKYAAARRATFEAGISRVQALSTKALDALEDLLGATKYPA